MFNKFFPEKPSDEDKNEIKDVQEEIRKSIKLIINKIAKHDPFISKPEWDLLSNNPLITIDWNNKNIPCICRLITYTYKYNPDLLTECIVKSIKKIIDDDAQYNILKHEITYNDEYQTLKCLLYNIKNSITVSHISYINTTAITTLNELSKNEKIFYNIIEENKTFKGSVLKECIDRLEDLNAMEKVHRKTIINLINFDSNKTYISDALQYMCDKSKFQYLKIIYYIINVKIKNNNIISSDDLFKCYQIYLKKYPSIIYYDPLVIKILYKFLDNFDIEDINMTSFYDKYMYNFDFNLKFSKNLICYFINNHEDYKCIEYNSFECIDRRFCEYTDKLVKLNKENRELKYSPLPGPEYMNILRDQFPLTGDPEQDKKRHFIFDLIF